MRNLTFVIVFVGLTLSFTGCVKRTNETSVLKAQVAELDAALRMQQEQNQALQAQLQSSGGTATATRTAQVPYTGSLYRTPSGFEIPGVDIQNALKNAGYYTGPVDGKIGPGSREAIRNFQRDNGMTADGVCGRQTWNKLKTYLK